MAEARTRLLVASMLVLLLASLVPVQADGETPVRLETELINAPLTPWYGPGDIVELSSALINDGVQTSITEDPSCGTVMIVSDQSGTVIIDERTTCRGQSRGLDVASGTTALDSHTWNLEDASGDQVAPGTYTVTVELAGSELSSSVDVNVQQNAGLPSELVYSSTLAYLGDSVAVGEPMVLSYKVYNPTALPIELSVTEECKLLIAFESNLFGPTCTPLVETIEPFSTFALGHSLLHATQQGESSIVVTTPDGMIINTHSLTVSQGELATEPLESSINTLSNSFIQGELLEGSMTLENIFDENVLLQFTNTCRMTYWVVDSLGNVVFDTLSQSNCNNAEYDMVLGPSELTMFAMQGWAFADSQGCAIRSGAYVVVTEVPEFGYFASKEIDFRRTSSVNCDSSPLPVVDIEIEANEADVVEFELLLNGDVGGSEIHWLEACKATLQMWDMNLESKIIDKNILCSSDESIDDSLQISNADTLRFSITDLDEYEFAEGEYRVRLHLAIDQDVDAEQTFTWPLPAEEVQDVETNDNGGATVQPVVLITGMWNDVSTSDGTCWMIEDAEENVRMMSSNSIATWSPERGASGMYEAVQTEANTPCSRFTADSYQIQSVIDEQPFVIEETVTETEGTENIVLENEETLPDWAPQAVAAVTIGALLSMLGFAAFNNEALRVSVTLSGLWILGLIGRTSETTDGRFQRGRLMGYLTANPGCHFRALLSALDMSNGQLSHHLRVLEQEESLWRRKDGRLVRYYPLTNNLHPMLEDEDLPVPILAPDPLSLQGKILLVLDQDGELGDFPTQAELAKRLDKSQQLISHHLRTLEKYGLIEGRRMGMRNRYKLTKEAMFLLETNEAFLRNELTF
ncbi:ArsR family transcriptional regulator [Candidatus Poseidoniales archaeon]|nr:ArsR family transcriptional regulator [Candidatus Poseidoniales archaeon]MDC3317061.1 ArsR family transcriptional regulator [Candidatus Poseidoniaceae archaeon]